MFFLYMFDEIFHSQHLFWIAKAEILFLLSNPTNVMGKV
jgi:hypothetical protein